MLFSTNTFAAAAADKKVNTVSDTANDTVKFSSNLQKTDSPSYIYLNEDGTYSVITASDRLYVQVRSADFKPVSQASFFISGSKFAGYYYDGKNHYIISANDRESDRTQLYIIDKYNEQGKKKGKSTIITAAKNNVDKTVVSGGLEIVRNGNILSMLDSVDFKKESNLGTQGCIIINYDIQHMTASILNEKHRIRFEDHKTDNSLKSYLAYGQENFLARCYRDLNSIVMKGVDFTNEEKAGEAYMFKTFESKKSADNGITLDGFDASKTNYIVAGTSVTQDANFEKNKDKNVFISTVSKTQIQSNLVRTKFITEYKEADGVDITNQQLVKVDDDNFILLWQEKRGTNTTVKYVSISGNADVGKVKEYKNGVLSNCKPIYNEGKLVWFSVDKNGNAPKFYEINLSGK